MLFMNLQKNYTKTCITSLEDNFNVLYHHKLFDEKPATKYFTILKDHLTYNSDEMSKVKIAGKELYIPRKQVAYGDDGTYYEFAGTRVNARSWNGGGIVCSTIKKIKNQVELFTGNKYNFVLINRYDNGNNYIGFHSDDERNLDKTAGIVGVSFGTEREFQFAPKNFIPKNLPAKISLILHHGSIVYMAEPTNSYWKHSVPKNTKLATSRVPRISLTFRHLLV